MLYIVNVTLNEIFQLNFEDHWKEYILVIIVTIKKKGLYWYYFYYHGSLTRDK